MRGAIPPLSKITSRILAVAFVDPDRVATKRTFDAMLTMKKIDLQRLKQLDTIEVFDIVP